PEQISEQIAQRRNGRESLVVERLVDLVLDQPRGDAARSLEHQDEALNDQQRNPQAPRRVLRRRSGVRLNDIGQRHDERRDDERQQIPEDGPAQPKAAAPEAHEHRIAPRQRTVQSRSDHRRSSSIKLISSDSMPERSGVNALIETSSESSSRSRRARAARS